MRCGQCGFEATPGAAFCSRCGYRTHEPHPAMKHEFAVSGLMASWWRFSNDLIAAFAPAAIAVALFILAAAGKTPWRGASIAVPLLLILSGLLFWRTALIRRRLRWNLTSERLIETRGLVATRRREMELADIRSIEVNRTLFQKMAGIGDVVIASAASADYAIHLADIAEPDRVAEAIRQARLKRLH